MELIKITDLSTQLGLSSRTLRYYEQEGLIESIRPEFEKYRYYDEKATERLRQIIVLRKMQIPIRDIKRIYESKDMSVLVEAFVERINEIDKEVMALSELKQIVNGFLQKMLQQGITKISALPLLYEEMSKQLEQMEENKEAAAEKITSFEKLNNIEKRLRKPIEVRMVKLPAMEMLCSKKKNSEHSDIDAFWTYLDKKGELDRLDGHTLLEFQDMYGQPVLLAKKTEQLSDSDFSNFSFTGGMFAIASTDADENVDEFLQSMIDSFHDNKFYKVNYKYGEQIAFVESVLSPEGRRDRIDLLIPVQPRIPDASFFEKTIIQTGLTVEEIEQANPILSRTDVTTYQPIENPYFKVNEDGIVEFIPYISIRTLSTGVKVKIPFRVDMEFMVDEKSERFGYGATEGSIRFDFGNSYFGINMENRPDSRKEALMFTEPLLGNVVILPKLGRISPNEYNRLTWIIGEKQFVVIVNDEIRYSASNMPYMDMDSRLQQAYSIVIGSNGQGKKYIKSVSVSQLCTTPRLNIKEGKLTMNTKRSNNIISNIHQVITPHFGENYWFNGCAKYVMECLGETEYTYSFFAGLTGDNFTQVYYKDHFRGDGATDYLLGDIGGEYIEQVFERIGYAGTFVTDKMLKSNREMYLQTLLAYIDKGIPVIRYHWFWCVIVGYEDYGKTLLIITGDNAEPERVPFDKVFDLPDGFTEDDSRMHGFGWFFVGEKTREMELSQIYRDAVYHLSKQLVINNEKYCFGAEAFRNWAADIKNGKYDQMKPEEFDDWAMYTCYVCALATNSGCGGSFLEKAQALNPDLTFCADIKRLYQHTGEMWNNQGGADLEGLGGGFNITLEALQDKERRDKIVTKILDFARTMDSVIEILNTNFDETGAVRSEKNTATDKETIQHFKTVNTTDWVNSPLVPNSNGVIKRGTDATGENTDGWFIDSLNGRWSTVYSTVEHVKAGEKVELLFWAKFEYGVTHELNLTITQSDWEKRAEYYMAEREPYVVKKQGDYCLYRAVYTAVEDQTVFINLSANDVIVFLLPAKEDDLNSISLKEEQQMPNYRIEQCYTECFPKCKFVGKCYKNSDRVDGMYSYHWGQWYENGWFEPLEQLITEEFKSTYPECEAPVGLMKNKYGAPDDYFEYWIGMFLPVDAKVPEGYGSIDIQHEAAGICFIKGKESNVFCHEGECYNEIVKHGMTIPSESDGGCYMFERYCCPRFTTPDENGEVILDLGFFVEKKCIIKDISKLNYEEQDASKLEYYNLPDARVIGKSIRCPLDRNAVNPIPVFWDRCIEDGSLDKIKAMPKLFSGVVGFTDDYDKATNTFLYIIGVICPKDTKVPEGYIYRDIPATVVSKGKYGEWLDECKPVWKADGYEWSGAQGQFWNAELYLDGENTDGFRLLCAVM